LTGEGRRAIVATTMSVITLLTDFGLCDGYAGVLKGVIWGIAPEAQIADITHQIRPQNVREGALALGRAAPFFPKDTIHLAVVDPGVGTARRPIAARLGDQFFVGPDNGLCSLLFFHARERGDVFLFFLLNRPKYWLAEVSSVFHGRDIFAPAAAHLASGIRLSELGDPIRQPVLLQIPEPRRTPTGWLGEVLHVDSFGNLSTNLDRGHVGAADSNLPLEGFQLRIKGASVSRLVRTFGDEAAGELVALFDSAGKLCICEVNGDAARRLEVQVGELVELTVESSAG